MKKTRDTSKKAEMRGEYDFSGAVRGKHYRAYRAGHTVRIHKASGATEVHHFSQEDGAVMLDPNAKPHITTADDADRKA